MCTRHTDIISTDRRMIVFLSNFIEIHQEYTYRFLGYTESIHLVGIHFNNAPLFTCKVEQLLMPALAVTNSNAAIEIASTPMWMLFRFASDSITPDTFVARHWHYNCKQFLLKRPNCILLTA